MARISNINDLKWLDTRFMVTTEELEKIKEMNGKAISPIEKDFESFKKRIEKIEKLQKKRNWKRRKL